MAHEEGGKLVGQYIGGLTKENFNTDPTVQDLSLKVNFAKYLYLKGCNNIPSKQLSRKPRHFS
jgi:hypothetical protein